MREFDIFKNTDDMTVERIASVHPVLTDEEKERMFAMSERKFNITEKRFPQGNVNNEMYGEDEVDGVEEYDRPAWLRYLTTAAALVLLGGGLALGKNLLHRGPAPGPDNSVPPVIATEVVTGTTVTSGADNSKYTSVTFDVDSMLTGISEAAPVNETTAAPVVTQAATEAATQAATEAPATTAAPVDELAAYKEIARDLETKWLKIERLNSNYYGNADIDRSFKVYKEYEDGSVLYDEPVYYVRGFDPDINTVDDYLNLHRSVFVNSPYYSDVYGAYPDENCFTIHPIISDENGIIYHSYYHLDTIGFTPQSGLAIAPSDPSYLLWHIIPEDEYNMIGDTDIIIQNVTEDSFDAIIPVCFYSPYGELLIKHEYDDSFHNYYTDKWHIVKVNGEWRISLGAQETREWVNYPYYMSMLKAQ